MQMKKFISFCVAVASVLLSLSAPAWAQTYTQVYDNQTRGDIVLSGNILVRPNNTAAVDNNSEAASKVDVDSDNTTDNSSSASLSIPANSTVLFAKLYWQSRISAVSTGTKTIKVSTTGSATGYQTVTSSAVTSLNTSNGIIYSAQADVTNIIKNVSSFPANILVGGANVETFPITSSDTTGSYAGWGLVVAYRQLGDPIRQLRVFDGFASVNGTPVDRALSGFRTPDAGTFTVKLGVIAFEGDRGITGDQLLVSKNGTTYNALSNAVNPADNFFNSTISQDGVSFTSSQLNPPLRSGGGQSNNSIGMDVDRIALTGPGTFFDNNQTSANLRFTTNGDVYQVTTFSTSIPTAEIVGRVFDDANFGGGAGRAYNAATAGMKGVAGTRVELYSGAGAFIKATTSDANGIYSFSELGSAAASTDYLVRVVNSTVAPTRAASTTGLLPVQTFRTDAKSSIDPTTNSANTLPLTNKVGGENPALADGASVNTVGAAIPANAQSVTRVQLGTEPVINVDFGFNFDTIVNTNDTGQGSLRQFVLNSNALNNATLDQVANPIFDPAAGIETSIFQIPASALTSGVGKITLASGLAITDASTSIDGRTQTANVGDTNTGNFGSGGTVGVGAIALPTVPKSEIEINGPNSVLVGLDINAGGAIVRNVSMWGFGSTGDSDTNATIRVTANGGATFTGPTITQTLLGLSASGSAPVAPANYGKGDLIRVLGIPNGTVTNSLLGFAGGKGMTLNGGANSWLIQANEFRNNARDSGAWDGIDAQVSNTQILENLSYNNGGGGIDTYASPGGSVIRNNTSRNNGLLCTPTSGESAGIRVYGTGASVTLNISNNNYGAGIQVQSGTTALISRNSIFGNGDVPSNATTQTSGQIGIDLIKTGDDDTHGTAPFVTPNASTGKGAGTGGNGLLNFPVITNQTVSGGNLTLEGFAPAGSTVEVFIAAPDPSGFGEGRTFAFNFVEGSGADSDATMGNYNSSALQTLGYPAAVAALVGSETGANRFKVTVPSGGLTSTSALTATATVANQTSEFSAVTVTFLRSTVGGTVYLDANRNATFDSTESGANINNLFIKAVLNGATSAAQAVPVDAATGAYNFIGLAPGTYTFVLDDNATLTDITPAIPAGYVGTESPGGARTVTVATQAVLNQNFGLFNGAQISGIVYEDGGGGTGPGLGGVKVNLTKADGTVIDTTTTDASGNFSFRVPNSVGAGVLKVVEFNLAGYNSVSGNVGTTSGAYDLPSDTISFTYAAGSIYSGLKFGDGRGITFTGEDAKTGTAGSSVFYPHVFTSQTGGSVTFTTTQLPTPANSGWSVVTFRDSNGNGILDGGDAQITAPVAVAAGVPITIFLQNFIPTTAANGAQDKLTVTANFTPTTGAAQSISRSDLTTVAANQGLLLSKTVDKTTAKSGDVLTYTITYKNTGAEALTNLVVKDATPAYTTFVSAANGTLPTGLTAPTIATPSVNSKGAVTWTFGGSLNPGQSGTVTFNVRVQ